MYPSLLLRLLNQSSISTLCRHCQNSLNLTVNSIQQQNTLYNNIHTTTTHNHENIANSNTDTLTHKSVTKPSTSTCTWNDLKIQSNLYNYLYNKLNLHKPTLIQQAAIPYLNRRPFDAEQYNDIIIHDITGHGKTLAYVLPILSNIDQYMNSVQCIILSPTRELATQIYNVVHELTIQCASKRKHNVSVHKHIRAQLLVGQVNPAMLSQLGVIDRFNDSIYANDNYDREVEREQKILRSDKSSGRDIVYNDHSADYVYTPHIIIGTCDTIHNILIEKSIYGVKSIKYIVADEVDAILSNDNNGKNTIDAILNLKQYTYSNNTIDQSITPVINKTSPLIEHEPDYGRAQIVLVSATITEHVNKLSTRHTKYNYMKYITVDTITNQITNKYKLRTTTTQIPTHIKHYYIVTKNKQQTLNALTSWIQSDFNIYQQSIHQQNNNHNPHSVKQSRLIGTPSSSVLLGGSNPTIDSSKQTTVCFFNQRNSITQDITNELIERNNIISMMSDTSSRSERRDALKLNRSNIILATDLLSRGLDIKTLTHIINYDVPNTYTQYIHRSGRVGRLGMIHSKCAVVINIIEQSHQHQQIAKLMKYITDAGVQNKLSELVIHNGTLHTVRNKQLQPVRLAPKIIHTTNNKSININNQSHNEQSQHKLQHA